MINDRLLMCEELVSTAPIFTLESACGFVCVRPFEKRLYGNVKTRSISGWISNTDLVAGVQ